MSTAMHSVRRAVIILLLLALFVAAAAVTFSVTHDLVLRAGAGLSGYWVDAAAQWAHWVLTQHARIVLASSVGAAVIALLLLILELRGVFKRQPRLILSRGGLGEIAITFDQVGLLAQHEAEAVEGVREVRTTAASAKDGLQVQQTIAVSPDRELPALAEEIQARVKRSLEFHLGFPVASVRVLLRHSSLSKALL